MSVDLTDLESTMQYTVEIVKNAVEATMIHYEKRSVNQKVAAKICFDALQKNFTIEQIWEHLPQKERDMVFEFLTPQEILVLKGAGLFKKAAEPKDDSE